jgi:type II secretory ATPase GspE/PulE/Tfp pilus assembly ATPase PilB-like protein
MNAELQAAVMARQPSAMIRQIALASGMRSLRAEGERQVTSGRTTRAEILRVCPE